MKYTDGKNIMVYAQSADGAPVGAALETVSKAAELAKANGEEVIAVVFGKDTDTKTVITAGASKVRKTCGEISAEGSLYGRNPGGKDDRPGSLRSL